MAPNKKQRKRIKRPKNRKLMIRDLPVSLAYLLHPSLRGILISRPKRWNSGSPQHRIAVNVLKKYKKQPKPRVFPFFCDKCRHSFRRLSSVKHHYCDKDEKRKADRKEWARKYSDYDCTYAMKLALNAEKQWRFNAMAIMEQTLRPDAVMPKRVEIEKSSTEMEFVDCEPDEDFFIAQEQEFEDETPHYPLNAVLEKSTQPPPPKTSLPKRDCSAGVFCFKCKGSFDSYNQFQLHLHEDYNDGKCSQNLPEYYYTETNDRTGMFSKVHKYSVMRHKLVKRDISHIQCTLCKAVNFASTGDLYSHMIKCATTANRDEKDPPIDCPTAFGYGMPPSFNACQYVFPDPARERTPAQKICSKEPSVPVS